MLSISDLKKIGTVCQINNEPYEVIAAQHVQMGRGGAILRLKIKNLITGNVLEKTLKGSDSLPEAEINLNKVNFLYSDHEGFHFMDNKTYEQISLSAKQVGQKANFCKEGSEVTILEFNGTPINLKLPTKMDFKVTSAPAGIRGDTAQGRVTKLVTIETGYELNVPLFVKESDTVKINTESGEYVGRV